MALIILDRDGVINFDSMHYIKSPDEWIPIPGSLEAIAKLNQLGFKVVVVSNQSGVSRGLYDLATLEQIHVKLQQSLAAVHGNIAEIFFCPHHPDEHCKCRKPKPYLLIEAKKKYQQHPAEKAYFIGDSLTDIQAANAANCSPVLVLSGKGKDTLKKLPQPCRVPYFADLAEAVAAEFYLS